MSVTSSSQLIFYVNGVKIVEENPKPETLLAHYLREKLKLPGTKVACGEGACGSCTVLLSKYDRQSKKILHYSTTACITPLCSLHGLAITTIEGIGSTKTTLHPIQRELAEGHGVQCGYCSPGMVMSMYALMKNNLKPSQLDIEHALKGNLCRCTGYRPILDAFKGFSVDNSGGCPMGENCCKNKKARTGDKCEEFSASEKSQELIFPRAFLYLVQKCSEITQIQKFTNELTECVLRFKLTDRYDEESLKFTSESITFYRPVTLKELLKLKHDHPEAAIVSGATSLVFRMRRSLLDKPLTLISTSGVRNLYEMSLTPEGLTLGAAVTMSNIESYLQSILHQLPEHKTRIVLEILAMFRVFGSPQIRNRATIGGSLALASHQADLNTILLTTNTIVEIQSESGNRKVKLNSEFYTDKNGPTILTNEEIVTAVTIPFPEESEYYTSAKLAPRKDMSLADVNGCLSVTFESLQSNVIKNVRLAFGGLDKKVTAIQLDTSCKAVVNRRWDDSLVDHWSPLVLAEIKERMKGDDVPVYKQILIQNFILKFFIKIYNQIQQKMSLSGLSEDFRMYLECGDRVDAHNGVQVYEVLDGESGVDAVGRPLPHRSAYQCSTGEAVFMDDMRPSIGELYLCPVISTKANARILEVDAMPALAIPGVVDYIDHNSLSEDQNWVHCGIPWAEKEQLFAVNEVHWVGQTIGAVVAESHDLARLAARAVRVKYEELEPIITIEEAISKNSYHPWPQSMGKLEYGDAKSAMSQAEHVIEGTFTIGSQEHFYMEPHAVRAVPTGEAGEMDVYAATQYQAGFQEKVAHVCGVQSNKITIHTKRMGGSFGGKEYRMFLVGLPTALAAKKLNRPVRCFLERGTDMQITGYRRPHLVKYKVGCDSEGKIAALDIDLYANDGYMLDYSQLFMMFTLSLINNCYSIPNISARGHSCKTNLPPCVPMRGAGSPQAVFVAEYYMSNVATQLGIPQHLVRERNLLKTGETSFFNTPIEESMSRCFYDSMKQSNYQQMMKDMAEFNAKSRYIKRGVCVLPIKFGTGMPHSWWMAGALVNIYLDGSVLISHGGIESGQGLHTKMIQVASRALGVPVEKIHISETNTSIIPNAVTTGGSSGTDRNGMAVMNACQKLVERLKPLRDSAPNASWEEIVKMANAHKLQLSATGYFNKATHEEFNWETCTGRMFNYFTYGSCATLTEVDLLTGEYKILSVDIVMDVGKSINPAIDVGQIEGGFMMGVGYHCLEKHEFDGSGNLVTKGSGKYHIPTVSSLPHSMRVTLLKNCDNQLAVYSSKGIGEPPLLLSSSVFFSIREAVLAARLERGLGKDFKFNSPATPQSILEATVQP